MKTMIAIVGALALAPVMFVAEAAAALEAAAVVQADAASIHEQALRSAIAAVQADAINYDKLTPALAENIRDQAPAIVPEIQALGPVQTVESRGVIDGEHTFHVVFANGATDWALAINDEGLISSILYEMAE